MKNIFRICVLFFVLSSLAYANVHCPKLDDIKAGNFQGWLPLDINDDEPVDESEITNFKNSLQHFIGADWAPDYEYGYGRCLYESDSEIYLASDEIPMPERPTHSPWQWDGVVAHCNSHAVTTCNFSK